MQHLRVGAAPSANIGTRFVDLRDLPSAACARNADKTRLEETAGSTGTQEVGIHSGPRRVGWPGTAPCRVKHLHAALWTRGHVEGREGKPAGGSGAGLADGVGPDCCDFPAAPAQEGIPGPGSSVPSTAPSGSPSRRLKRAAWAAGANFYRAERRSSQKSARAFSFWDVSLKLKVVRGPATYEFRLMTSLCPRLSCAPLHRTSLALASPQECWTYRA